jgi:hypothetical protein
VGWAGAYEKNVESSSSEGWSGPGQVAPRPVFTCPVCDLVFYSVEDLLVHQFDGHSVTRPTIFLQGRECGRSRVSVLTATSPEDWEIVGADSIMLNGKYVDVSQAKSILSLATKGFIKVQLTTTGVNQTFDLNFQIAEQSDLDGIEKALQRFVSRRELTIPSIESFLKETSSFITCDNYRFGIANYFYGVLAREGSPHSGLNLNISDETPYVKKFEESVDQVMGYVRPGADAICGLVAFHFNQFDIAMRRTFSPRVARASIRLHQLLNGEGGESVKEGILLSGSMDVAMCDGETEMALDLCCLPLNAAYTGHFESALSDLNRFEQFDQLKVRVIAAEHFMEIGDFKRAAEVASPLRHNRLSESWCSGLARRIEKLSGK